MHWAQSFSAHAPAFPNPDTCSSPVATEILPQTRQNLGAVEDHVNRNETAVLWVRQ